MKYFLVVLVALTASCTSLGGKDSRATQDLRFLAIAAANYTTAFNGRIPPNWEATEMFLGDFDPRETYEIVAKGNVRDYPDIENTVLIQQITPNANGQRMAAFMDGHVGPVQE